MRLSRMNLWFWVRCAPPKSFGADELGHGRAVLRASAAWDSRARRFLDGGRRAGGRQQYVVVALDHAWNSGSCGGRQLGGEDARRPDLDDLSSASRARRGSGRPDVIGQISPEFGWGSKSQERSEARIKPASLWSDIEFNSLRRLESRWPQKWTSSFRPTESSHRQRPYLGT